MPLYALGGFKIPLSMAWIFALGTSLVRRPQWTVTSCCGWRTHAKFPSTAAVADGVAPCQSSPDDMTLPWPEPGQRCRGGEGADQLMVPDATGLAVDAEGTMDW